MIKPLSKSPRKRLDDGFAYGFGFWLSFYVVSFVFIPVMLCMAGLVVAAMGGGN
jgi:hypothetical protein